MDTIEALRKIDKLRADEEKAFQEFRAEVKKGEGNKEEIVKANTVWLLNRVRLSIFARKFAGDIES